MLRIIECCKEKSTVWGILKQILAVIFLARGSFEQYNQRLMKQWWKSDKSRKKRELRVCLIGSNLKLRNMKIIYNQITKVVFD